MKKAIPVLAVLFCTVTMLNSCTVNKIASVHTNAGIENSNETNSTCFIQLKDGTIKPYKTLKLVTGILTSPHLLADEKEVIYGKDIMAYQNHRHYAVSSKILTSIKSGNVAVETLPGFAIKVMSGKLNVYTRKFYNGANAAEEYFLQTGNDGYIISYTKKALISLIKEDSKATEFFNSKTKAFSFSQKLLTTVEMYNSNQLMTKN